MLRPLVSGVAEPYPSFHIAGVPEVWACLMFQVPWVKAGLISLNKGHPYWPCPCSNWKEMGCREMQQELGQQAEPRARANRTLLSCTGGKAESHQGGSAECISATHQGMSNSAKALEMTVIYLFPLKSSKKRQDFDSLLGKEHRLVTDWNHRIDTLWLEEIAMPISEAGCDD